MTHRLIAISLVLASCGRGTVATDPAPCPTWETELSPADEVEPGLWVGSTGARSHGCGVYALDVELDVRAPDPQDWRMRQRFRVCNACETTASLDFLGFGQTADPVVLPSLFESTARVGLVDEDGTVYVEGCGHYGIRVPEVHAVWQSQLRPGASMMVERDVNILTSLFHGTLTHIDQPYWRSPIDYARIAATTVYWPKLWLAELTPAFEHLASLDSTCAELGFSPSNSASYGRLGFYEDDVGMLLVLPPLLVEHIEGLER